ncbi:F-box protein At5g03100-like [Miscanthus floridulus]|uniref:F-box protein At5g03100-like n=1 Tax=Miscanthus floridulus TaxID=154761 RepID=UPI003459973F
MHPGESSKRAAPPALSSGGSIDALPDGVLEHIVGFVPAPEAVQTCVLARRWRYLWRSAPGLRVGWLGDGPGLHLGWPGDEEQASPPVKEHRELVDRLLLLRGGSPLDTCDIRLGEFQDDDVPRVNFWVWHAISCKVRQFTLSIHWHSYLKLDDLPLVSQHLTRLELRGVWVDSSFLDFSSCPALEYLDLLHCDLSTVKNISSYSLKHLSITQSRFPDDFDQFMFTGVLETRNRTCIYAPNLVSLRLDGLENLTPRLVSMPSLVEASVRITDDCGDYCVMLSEPDITDCLCELCDSSRGGTGYSCVLFQSLSKAKSLLLTCNTSDTLPQILFKWDLRWCPVFSMLKTLVLNEYWCVPDDANLLLRILEHTPVLEELTLELFSEGPNYEVEMKGSINQMDRSAKISEYLNIVKIKCQILDESVLNVLELLRTFGICFGF